VTKKVAQEELQLLSALRDAQIPLDDEVTEGMKVASRALSIYQTGSVNENDIFELDFGGTGFMLSIAICNDSNRIISLQAFHLAMPWPETDFRWLEDPLRSVPREYTYSFFEGGPVAFEREVVLNHRLGRRGRLCPGDSFEGLLLGMGQLPIPDKHRDGQGLRTQLSIFDGQGNRYELNAQFRVSRREPQRRGQVRKSVRSGESRFVADAGPATLPTHKIGTRGL
jgi:hypothetical protein